MKKYYVLLICLSFLVSCATQKTKYATDSKREDVTTTKQVSHTVYLIGDAGLSEDGTANETLMSFKSRLDKAGENSTAIFLGDNIYPAGMPHKKKEPVKYKQAKRYLDAQLSTLENFKGRPLFIPGKSRLV